MYLFGNVFAVHFIQDIFEWGDVVIILHGVDAVIHGNVAHTVPGEEVLNQDTCL